MSKEQLGEIMHDFRRKLALGHVDMDVLNSAAEIHELVIEQTERVQELEKELTYYKMATESYVELEKRNKRYREVLEFYADKENYKPFNGIFLSDYQDEVDKDGGEKARKALEATE